MNSPLAYLLDTDICVYLLNGNPQIITHVRQVGVESIAISIVTVAELLFGAHNSIQIDSNIERIRAFLAPPGPLILPLDLESASLFGKFKSELRRQGKPVGDFDLLIAATAARNGLELVTNNTAHFERIGEISVSNWLKTTG